MFQTKKLDKELNEMDASYLLDRVQIVMKMLIKLCRQMDKLSKSFNKEIKRTEEHNNN